ncbi:hypothetical protein JW835_07315 [bacterium]|nr:hypothetical protein [bacterium]
MNKKCFYHVILCISFFNIVHAQSSSRSLSAGISAGLGIPVFNAVFRDYWNKGGNVGLEFQLYLSSRIAFCPRVCYHRFELNQNRIQDDLGSSVAESGGQIHFKHGRRDAWETGASFQLYLSQPEDVVDFYLTFGGSYCAVLYDDVQGVFEKDDQKFIEILRDKVSFHGYGPQGGFGLEYWLNQRLCVFGEAQLHFLIASLAANRPENDDEIEYVFYYDSKYMAFISVLWGIRFDF